MSTAINIPIFIHGMNPSREAMSPVTEYKRFWNALQDEQPTLRQLMREPVFVEWGHQLTPGQTVFRDDQKLTEAEDYIHDRVGFDEVRKREGPNNVLIGGWFGDFGLPVVRQIATTVRESAVLHGLTDVVYYTSADGERQVRRVVYDQVLQGLDEHLAAADVRFHIFAHSLGVTLAHDFLFGLFNTLKTPDFVLDDAGGDPEVERSQQRYQAWRDKAQNGTLSLGGFSSAASQIPLFVMRKPALIDRLFRREGIDATQIGIRNNGVQWKIFYDIDDILGFATRDLYAPNEGIMDWQVDCGNQPLDAHIGYWQNETVISETAKLFRDWAD
jgi:hypothetical protein